MTVHWQMAVIIQNLINHCCHALDRWSTQSLLLKPAARLCYSVQIVEGKFNTLAPRFLQQNSEMQLVTPHFWTAVPCSCKTHDCPFSCWIVACKVFVQNYWVAPFKHKFSLEIHQHSRTERSVKWQETKSHPVSHPECDMNQTLFNAMTPSAHTHMSLFTLDPSNATEQCTADSPMFVRK